MSDGIGNSAFWEQHIIGVPLDLTIMHDIIVGCHDCNSVVGDELTKMLFEWLQSHSKFKEQWETSVKILLPFLPHMHGLSDAPSLMRQLLFSYKPNKRMFNLHAMLQGNIRFLFHADEKLRKESLSRLLDLLSTREDASAYLPDLRIINVVLPNDICVVQPPRDMSSIFIASNSSQMEIDDVLSGLYAEINISKGELSICKPALFQLRTLSQDWQTATIMLNGDVDILAISVLKSSLQLKSQDKQENCKPAISILAKLLLVDAKLRIKYKDDMMLQVLLLRALFVLPNDMELRQDASLCLFLLVFPMNYEIQPPSSKTSAIIKASGLLKSLKVPFKFKTIAPRSELPPVANVVEISDIFKDEREKCLYVQHVMSFEYNNISTEHSFVMKIPNWDSSLAKATCPDYCLRIFLQILCNPMGDSKILTDVSSHMELMLTLLDFLNENSQVSNEVGGQLSDTLNKVLEVLPASDLDYERFEKFLDLAITCVDVGHAQFLKSFKETLQGNFNHAIIQLSQKQDTPLRLHNNLIKLLTNLAKLQDHSKSPQTLAVLMYYEELFTSGMKSLKLLLKHQDFLRARCLLLHIVQLAGFGLSYSDDELMAYYEDVLDVSAALKTFTQTGVQWQRMCLLLLEHLSRQLLAKSNILKSAVSAIKLTSRLCSHPDVEVRNLAWLHMTTIAKCKEHKKSSIVGANLLLSELSYLQGGLLSWCLSTFLNASEAIIVRSSAGNLFATLLKFASVDVTSVVGLLDRHKYFTRIHKTMDYFTSSANISLKLHHNSSDQRDYINTDIVRCYCSIASALIKLQPSFVEQLFKQSFILDVNEVFKKPLDDLSASYYAMVAEILNLYMQFKSEHFSILQQVFYRDQVWLTNYFQLLKASLGIQSQYVIAKLLQTLQMLCSDEIAWASILVKIADEPHVLLAIFMRLFTMEHINSSIQQVGLNTLSVLLGTSRAGLAQEQHSLVEIVEQLHFTTDDDRQTTGAKFLFGRIFGIWQLQYPVKSNHFDRLPTDNQKMINTTLSQLLLKSKKAQSDAKQVELLEKILNILKSFFDEYKMTSTLFIQRYGDERHMSVIANMHELLMIILHWECSSDGIRIDTIPLAHTFSKVMSLIWSWSQHSLELKQHVLCVSARATEHSLLVCDAFTSAGDSTHSLLELIFEFICSEGAKGKSPCMPIIIEGMNVITNCCACADGRKIIAKKNLSEVLHKDMESNSDLLLIWLRMYEVFTRHKDIQQVRCFKKLFNYVECSSQGDKVRRFALLILNNYCFLTPNYSHILTSKSFLSMIEKIFPKDLIEPNRSEDDLSKVLGEVWIIVVLTWRLLATSEDNLPTLRDSKLAEKLGTFRAQIALLETSNLITPGILLNVKYIKQDVDTVLYLIN